MFKVVHLAVNVYSNVLFLRIHNHACSVHFVYTNACSRRWMNFSEADNGRIFAPIGIFGIIAQGVLIGPLNRRFGTKITCSSRLRNWFGSGTAWVNQMHMLLILVCALIAGGNGIFQPSANTIATEYAREKDMELGMVMGSVGAAGAFAEFLVQSPAELSGQLLKEVQITVHNRICGLFMLLACITSMGYRQQGQISNSIKVN